MPEGDVDDAVANAEHALADVGRDPRAALAEADAVVAAIPRPREPEQVQAVVTAHRAAGLALRELSELEAAEARMRRAVRVADRHGLPAVAADARMSLAYVVMERGRMRHALSLTTRALETAIGPTTYRLRIIRAMTLQRTGRGDEALAEYATALPAARRARDTVWESRLLNNRAILLAIRGQTAHAVRDFERAREIYLGEGLIADAAAVLYNLGYLYGMAGDIPRALEHLDAAAAESGDLDRPEYWIGRSEVLARAGLAADAIRDARAAAELLRQRGWRTLEVETWLRLAGGLLASPEPDLDGAQDAISRARRLVRHQGRPEWSALGDYLDLSVQLMRRQGDGSLVRAEAVAGRLRALGWNQHADDLLVSCALRVHERDSERAAQLLDRVGSHERTSLDWPSRSAERLARSFRAEAVGDLAAAERDLTRAWAIADEAQSLVGATDLRAGTQSRSRHLVDLGVRASLRAGSAESAFTWAERGRSSILRHPPARPASESDVADALTRWRWAASAESDQRLNGKSPGRESRALRAAEWQVRRHVRRIRSVAGDSSPATPEGVRAEIGSGVFVQYLVSDDNLWATTTRASQTELIRLCPSADAELLVRSLTFALRRAVTADRFDSNERADELARICARLDRLVVDPLELQPDEQHIAICAVKPLTDVPWNLVPSLSDRVATAAPSATSWCRAFALPSRRLDLVVVAAGPGLPGAEQECASIGSIHPNARVMLGALATTQEIRAGLAETGMLHLAAHGRLRRDNPLFSTLALADGPLCGYDIASWPSAPETVILSACGAGATAAVAGDEVLGLASIVLGAGARTVIGAAVPVPDDLTASAMVHLHEHLAAGLPAARALHECQVSFDDDPVARVVARSFVAVGA